MLDIKRVTAKDDLKKLVLDIRKAQWVPASEISPEDYSVRDLKAFLVRTESVFIVAYCDEQLAGMASAKILNKPNGDIWLYIDEVDVCENFQKQGIGKALMNYLFSFAQESNCDEVWLGTEVDNVPANALYTSIKPSEIQKFIGYTYILKK
ncbi:MAG: GNAT family N-acetyltransferase [Saprospiraceae bacterium]|jgi:ribosomal protein S18 acetylase RimI-like enzyme|nr:GNAT family N-acetyltransferase [Saprospiraceae bacterium]